MRRQRRRAEWPSAEGKSPAVGGGRLGVRSLPAAGAGPEPGGGRNRGPTGFCGRRGSSRSRAARPHRAGAGGREVCGLLSPDVRRRRPLRPERAPWGPRSPWRWAPSTTWHFSCNSAAPRGPPATRPGTITSPATVSWVAAPADFPTKPHPGQRGSDLASPDSSPRRRWRESEGGRPLPGLRTGPGLLATPADEGAPRVAPPCHSRGGLLSHPLHSRGYIHLHDQPRTHSHTRCFLTQLLPSYISRHLGSPSLLCPLDTQQARPEGSHPASWHPRAQLLPARLPADTVAKYTHL